MCTLSHRKAKQKETEVLCALPPFVFTTQIVHLLHFQYCRGLPHQSCRLCYCLYGHLPVPFFDAVPNGCKVGVALARPERWSKHNVLEL